MDPDAVDGAGRWLAVAALRGRWFVAEPACEDVAVGRAVSGVGQGPPASWRCAKSGLTFEACGGPLLQGAEDGSRRGGRCGALVRRRRPPWPLVRRRTGLRGRGRRTRSQRLPADPCLRVLSSHRALDRPVEPVPKRLAAPRIRPELPVSSAWGPLCRPASARPLPRRSVTRPPHRSRTPTKACRDAFRPRGFTPPRRFSPRAAPDRVRSLFHERGRKRIAACCRLGFAAFPRRPPRPPNVAVPRPREDRRFPATLIPPEDALAGSRTVSPRPVPPCWFRPPPDLGWARIRFRGPPRIRAS
jgi:hypothetical protein